jgi:hypothetical protein
LGPVHTPHPPPGKGAPREPLEDYAATLPGSRVLTDAYGVNRVGIAIQQGHPGRLTYISEFVEEAKASGLVQRTIDRAGLAKFRVAPFSAHQLNGSRCRSRQPERLAHKGIKGAFMAAPGP